MFQLIVAVISIALIAALAGASIFYGGSAFSGSTAKANVSALINQGQQIGGAMALYRTDNGGANAGTIQALIDGAYLQSAPAVPAVADTGAAWTLTTDGAFAYVKLAPDAAANTCAEVTAQNGGVAAEAEADLDDPALMEIGDSVPFNCLGDPEAEPVEDVYFAYRM